MAMNPMIGMGRPPAMGGMPPSMGVAPMGQAPSPQMSGGIAPSTGNVMQITSTLRDMSDSQLKQYAAMHKNDPFVFPLAFQESKERSRLRAAQMAQGAGQKPPSVVDQDLAQMTPTPVTGGAGQTITGGHGQAINALPEDQGIGALNAPNLQRMADGGIAGYADGGPQQPGMFNYAQMAPAVDLHPNSGVTSRNMASGGTAHFAAGSREPIYGGDPMGTGAFDIESSGKSSARPFWEQFFNAPEQPKWKQELEKETIEKAQEEKLKKDTAKANATKELSDLTSGKKPLSVLDTSTSGGSSKKIKPIAESKPIVESKPTTPETDAYQEVLDKYKPMSQEDRQKMLKGYTKVSNEEMEEAYKPFAEMNAKERDELKSRVESDKGEAILRAGLAIMGGSSPFALKNIGEGATAGLSALQEARKTTDAAKRASTQADLLLMQAQRAERSGNQKDAVALMNQQRQEEAHAVDLGLKALTSKDLSRYQDTAGKAALMQAGAAQTAAGAAVTRANALNSQYNDQAKLRAEYGKIQQAVMKTLQNNPVFQTMTPQQQEVEHNKLLRAEMMRNPFLSAYASGIGFSQQPAGKVYDLTDDREDR